MSRARDFADLAGSADAGGISGKNLLVNGSMVISQRGASLAVAHDGVTGGYLIDRWNNALGGTHEQLDATYAQVADHPLSANGKSLKWTTGTAESSYDSDEYVYFAQLVEAQNLQHLNYGNSNAKAVTLSFYVKSSVTGTFACNLYKPDGTARVINKTYAISSANTWEKKSLTFPADTGGGGIVNDNGIGLYVVWHLAAGSGVVGGGSNGAWKNYGGLTDWADGQATNAVATTASATWQMTDCQLEVGEQATPFEHRSYADELLSCQRYYQISGSSSNYHVFPGQRWSSNNIFFSVPIATSMRANPTIGSDISGNFGFIGGNNQSKSFSLSEMNFVSLDSTSITARVTVDFTPNSAYAYTGYFNTAGELQADAEL
jgi:hypothetical protein